MGALVIPSIFTAVDQMTPTTQKMRAGIISFGNSAEAAMARTERAVRRLTPGLGGLQKQMLSMVGTGAALAGAFQLGSFSFNALTDYETAVDAFRVIVSDLNDTEFAPFQNKIDEVAKHTKKSSVFVAQAFEQIASKNAKFAETADGLGQVAEATITLAKAAKMDLQPAAESLIGIMNQYSFEADQANRTINVLAAGQAVGAASIAQTAEAFVNLGPTAASANVSLEQSVGLIQTLAKFSLYGADAGTALRGSIIKLQKAGLGYASGQFSINDALDDTNKLLDKLKTAKQKDALITAIFGIHNITAGKILTANRETYKQFTAAVTQTSEAQKGAAINSGNLKTVLEQLGAGWINMITTSGPVGGAMDTISNAAIWLTDNLESVVSTVMTGVKWFIIYKATMFSAKAVLTAWNITLGISSALQGASSVAMAGNTTALTAQRIALIFTRSALMGTTVATEAATVATVSLNGAMAANPFGIVLLAITALAAGVLYLTHVHSELRKEYERSINTRIEGAMQGEELRINKLIDSYMKLGKSRKEAAQMAIYQERVNIELERQKKKAELETLHNELKQHQGTVMNQGGGTTTFDLPGADAVRDKIVQKEREETVLAGRSLDLMNFVIRNTKQGAQQPSQMPVGERDKFTSGESQRIITKDDWQDEATRSDKLQLTMIVKNDTNNEVSINSGKTTLINVLPNVSSTKVIDKYLYGR